jgi:hypothetical protein
MIAILLPTDMFTKVAALLWWAVIVSVGLGLLFLLLRRLVRGLGK